MGGGVGDIGPAVLRDRDSLARDGFVVVVVQVNLKAGKLIGKPQLVSRGFVYQKAAEELMEGAKEVISDEVKTMLGIQGTLSKQQVSDIVVGAVAKYFRDEIKRRPMIIPVVVEEEQK